jgi:hypothetical protein
VDLARSSEHENCLWYYPVLSTSYALSTEFHRWHFSGLISTIVEILRVHAI